MVTSLDMDGYDLIDVDRINMLGATSQFEMADRDGGGNPWILYHNAGLFRLYNGSDRLTLSTTTLTMTGYVTASSGIYGGVLNASEAGLGYNMNAAGHEGIGIHHDGAIGYITCFDQAVAWHDIHYKGSAHTWFVDGVAEMVLTATALYPYTDAGVALGNSTRRWADLFMDSGAVIYADATNVIDLLTTEVNVKVILDCNAAAASRFVFPVGANKYAT